MATFNITEVRLLSVPLENDYKHTLYFESVEAQTEYFLSRPAIGGVNFSYQRKDGYIAYPRIYDSLIGYNYVMYKNSAYGNKWFYAFITDMKYVNDERTDIYIETDVIQTWWKQYVVKPSFIEREHVRDDNIGVNIFDEGLQLGEYVCNKHTNAGAGTGVRFIVVGVTETPQGEQVSGTIYSGIYSGLRYYCFPHTADGVTALQSWLANYDKEAQAEAVQCMFLAPGSLVGLPQTGGDPVFGASVSTIKINHNTGELLDYNIGISSGKLNGYTPHNNKLYTYPYRYMICSNNNGVSVPLVYEYFKKDGIIIDPAFTIEGCLTPGGSIRIVPNYYKGTDRNDEEGINLGKFPALNWSSDVYTNWLTQNAVNIGVSIASDVVQIGAGAAVTAVSGGIGMIGGASSIASGVNGILGTVGEIYKASKIPPQSKGNTNCGDVITATQSNDFHFYDMSIMAQYAEAIDEFFDMFGYKVNRVKVPYENHRQRYWYTKTIDANIDGAIPTDDMAKIKACYNNGITFWRSTEAIGYYSTVDINGNKVYNPIVYN